MTLLGTLLKNRRGRDADAAWNRPNLDGPELLRVTSEQFADGGTIPLDHAGKRVGGKNVSPTLIWSGLPPETTEMLLVVEDLDVPTPKPAVHCLALIDPTRLEMPNQLPQGALSGKDPAVGVRILRSVIGRGYQGPEPLKGHGPHRYDFQLFAFAAATGGGAYATNADQIRPRAFMESVAAPVIARGHLTGVLER